MPLLYLPELHVTVVQLDAPADEVSPAGHSAQLVWPVEPWYLPAGQLVQADCPVEP